MLSVGAGLKILSWFTGGGLDGLMKSATNIYTAKLQAGNDAEKIAADLAARQLQLDAKDADLQAQLTRSSVFSPRELMGYAVGVYVAKILVWDKCLHLGVTDALDDRMWWIVATIIIAYFGARAIRDFSTFRK